MVHVILLTQGEMFQISVWKLILLGGWMGAISNKTLSQSLTRKVL